MAPQTPYKDKLLNHEGSIEKDGVVSDELGKEAKDDNSRSL